MYTNNPAYKLELQTDTVRIFTPVQTTDGYHTTRYIEAINQQIYNNAGATREVLDEVMAAIIGICNDEKEREWRTKIGALAESIKYRLKYPVDQHCAVRMGCILSFMEEDVQPVNVNAPHGASISHQTLSEPHDKVEYLWLEKKMKLAFEDSKFYDFFLTWGIVNTPKYNEASDILNDSEYFVKRMQVIQSLTKNLINPLKK